MVYGGPRQQSWQTKLEGIFGRLAVRTPALGRQHGFDSHPKSNRDKLKNLIMKQIIDCPYCDGQAHLQKTANELAFKKELFKVVEHFYKCDKCEEEFTTTETDAVTLLQAQNRERYFIH